MSHRVLSALFAVLALALSASVALAQTWTAEQQEVWKLELRQWEMARDEDLGWIEQMVHPNISYWDFDQQFPQNKDSLSRWSRYGNANSTVLEQELFPFSITITGDVAVVQYRYAIARENYEKERSTASGRYTDVLVKENGRWMFIAWAGGDDPED